MEKQSGSSSRKLVNHDSKGVVGNIKLLDSTMFPFGAIVKDLIPLIAA